MPLLADVSDEQMVAQLRAHGKRIERARGVLWFDEKQLSPAVANEFASQLSSGVDEIEAVLHDKYDARHFGQAKIECFVSSDAGPSHAYMGRKPYFFVTPERVNAREVPYRHELTHIVAWWSCGKAFWLQEGFADYVSTEARTRFPHEPAYDMNVFNPKNEDIDEVASRSAKAQRAEKMLSLIGADATPVSGWRRRAFDAIFDDREIAAPAFYNLSHSFTRFLIGRVGLSSLEAACRAWKPSRSIGRRAGEPMGQLRSEWLATIGERASRPH